MNPTSKKFSCSLTAAHSNNSKLISILVILIVLPYRVTSTIDNYPHPQHPVMKDISSTQKRNKVLYETFKSSMGSDNFIIHKINDPKLDLHCIKEVGHIILKDDTIIFEIKWYEVRNDGQCGVKLEYKRNEFAGLESLFNHYSSLNDHFQGTFTHYLRFWNLPEDLEVGRFATNDMMEARGAARYNISFINKIASLTQMSEKMRRLNDLIRKFVMKKPAKGKSLRKFRNWNIGTKRCCDCNGKLRLRWKFTVCRACNMPTCKKGSKKMPGTHRRVVTFENDEKDVVCGKCFETYDWKDKSH